MSDSNYAKRELNIAVAWVLAVTIVCVSLYAMVSNTNHRKIVTAQVSATAGQNK